MTERAVAVEVRALRQFRMRMYMYAVHVYALRHLLSCLFGIKRVLRVWHAAGVRGSSSPKRTALRGCR